MEMPLQVEVTKQTEITLSITSDIDLVNPTAIKHPMQQDKSQPKASKL